MPGMGQVKPKGFLHVQEMCMHTQPHTCTHVCKHTFTPHALTYVKINVTRLRFDLHWLWEDLEMLDLAATTRHLLGV